VFERSSALDFIFAPRSTTVLTLRLKTPGTPYWQRPDLGVGPEDIQVNGREVRVRIHNLGSVPSPSTTVALRNRDGVVIATGKVPSIPAPVDLLPKTTEAIMRVPEGTEPISGTVEIDPDRQINEITRLNNTVTF
jgi:hypothetical protein